MERGDTGVGRDAYGLPRRRRPGEHRAYRPRAAVDEPADADGVSDDEYYGQLLRRPDESQPRPRLRQQGRPRMRQPGRFPSPGSGGYPAGGPANGDPANGWAPMGGQPNGGQGTADRAARGTAASGTATSGGAGGRGTAGNGPRERRPRKRRTCRWPGDQRPGAAGRGTADWGTAREWAARAGRLASTGCRTGGGFPPVMTSLTARSGRERRGPRAVGSGRVRDRLLGVRSARIRSATPGVGRGAPLVSRRFRVPAEAAGLMAPGGPRPGRTWGHGRRT